MWDHFALFLLDYIFLSGKYQTKKMRDVRSAICDVRCGMCGLLYVMRNERGEAFVFLSHIAYHTSQISLSHHTSHIILLTSQIIPLA